MEKYSLISVVICTYNRCESLKDTLDSLLNQEDDGSFDWEVLVVDNNSKDKTKEVVESYKAKFNGRLRYLFEPRQGKSYALNTGIKEAKGEIIAFTDDDCIVDRKWIMNILNAFKTEKAESITGKVIPIWNNRRPKWYSNEIKTVIPDIDEGDIIKPAALLVGANMAFKKSVFDRVGIFDYITKSEDTFFSYKIRGKYSMWYIPTLKVFHKVFPERLTQIYFRKWYFNSGKAISIIRTKYEPEKKKFLNIPLWMYKEFIFYIFSYIKNFNDEKKRFFYELQIWRFLGFCCQRW